MSKMRRGFSKLRSSLVYPSIFLIEPALIQVESSQARMAAREGGGRTLSCDRNWGPGQRAEVSSQLHFVPFNRGQCGRWAPPAPSRSVPRRDARWDMGEGRDEGPRPLGRRPASAPWGNTSGEATFSGRSGGRGLERFGGMEFDL